MDPYDILGIRPHAGREEIELAYKGRRSQYYPDRYGQSDVQTQAWATEGMQAVNHAYVILGAPDERARFDRSMPRSLGRSHFRGRSQGSRSGRPHEAWNQTRSPLIFLSLCAPQ